MFVKSGIHLEIVFSMANLILRLFACSKAPKDHQGGASAIALESLFTSSALGHTVVSAAAKWEGAVPSLVSGKHL